MQGKVTVEKTLKRAGAVVGLNAGRLDQPQRPNQPHGGRRLAIEGVSWPVGKYLRIHLSLLMFVEALRDR
jgi:hypothetical protein